MALKKWAADFDENKSKNISKNAIKKYNYKVVAHQWKELYEKSIFKYKND